MHPLIPHAFESFQPETQCFQPDAMLRYQYPDTGSSVGSAATCYPDAGFAHQAIRTSSRTVGRSQDLAKARKAKRG